VRRPERLPTANDRLVLVPIEAAHVPALLDLAKKNEAHLSEYGDYSSLLESTAEAFTAELARNTDGELMTAMMCGGEIIGVASLIRYREHVFGLGYWVDKAFEGRGLVSAACRALIDHAVHTYAATEIWAGTSHGNERSIALVQRLGMRKVREQAGHLSFMLEVKKRGEPKAP
jgi:RimJ/RimL family protein N-acetyltransferase